MSMKFTEKEDIEKAGRGIETIRIAEDLADKINKMGGASAYLQAFLGVDREEREG